MARNKQNRTELPEADQMGSLMIEVPELLHVPEEAYCVRHVEGVLNDSEARILKRLLHTLEFRGEQLADGTWVKRPAHAIRWILEQIKAAE